MAYRRFEDEEAMRRVVRIDGLARVAQILGAVRAPEPLPLNTSHTTVAHCRCVRERTKIVFVTYKSQLKICY
jgi:hypothetical protein